MQQLVRLVYSPHIMCLLNYITSPIAHHVLAQAACLHILDIEISTAIFLGDLSFISQPQISVHSAHNTHVSNTRGSSYTVKHHYSNINNTEHVM